MFSPLAFPAGLVLYDLITSIPPTSHTSLAPFELYRQPLIVVGIADGRDGGTAGNGRLEARAKSNSDTESDTSNTEEAAFISLQEELEKLRVQFSSALVHSVFIFDSDATDDLLSAHITTVPSPEKSKTTTIKTLMSDMTSKLLAEMTTYAKSLQALSSLESPRSHENPSNANGSRPYSAPFPNSSSPAPAPGLQRQFSGDATSRPHPTSTPAHLSSASHSRASTAGERTSSPANGTRTPPTSFDEITRSSQFGSPSKTVNYENQRPDSRDKASTSGFGADGLVERERLKGKGRVGLAIGALYLLAGRWPDAMKELVDSATIARANTDYIWHAKAFDLILVCLLMQGWAGMNFRVSLQRSPFSGDAC